jgi:glycosyltransferase involved in cell wall biosynthesis
VVVHSQTVRRSLRVAVVTETYPPEVNGVAATASRVVEGLRERGHQMQLLRPRQNDLDLGTERKGLHQVLLRGLPIPRYPELKMGLPCKKTLLGLWQNQRPDVVHIVTEGPLGWSALQAATQLSLPVVSDFRTNFHAYSQHYGIGWLSGPVMAYLRKFHNRSACTMVPTTALRSELMSGGFKNLNVVARGVDTQGFNPARRSEALRHSWGAGPDTMVVLCVGRLAPEKNLDTVLDAFEAMRQQEPRLRLVLVGDGPDKTRLMRRCPDALFAGVRRGEDLAAHYASADVFLFASVTETFGNVVTEAMASGLAVVAYDHAAAGQLLRHGENGLLALCGDKPEFCRVARRLAGELQQARALGVAARSTAMDLDWGRIVDAVETVYGAAILGADVRPLTDWKPAMPMA